MQSCDRCYKQASHPVAPETRAPVVLCDRCYADYGAVVEAFLTGKDFTVTAIAADTPPAASDPIAASVVMP